jgi:hypothetical protein
MLFLTPYNFQQQDSTLFKQKKKRAREQQTGDHDEQRDNGEDSEEPWKGI